MADTSYVLRLTPPDFIWTHRWQAAKAPKEETTIKISGIDRSAVFETINRLNKTNSFNVAQSLTQE